jgi:hypothetical protein
MIIRNKPPRTLKLDEPILHRDAHKRPVTRRDFISQGFMTGAATVAAPAGLAALLKSGGAEAALASDVEAVKAACGITAGAGKIPFICIDLAGGANMVGSNVLIGGQGGQLDLLSTGAYAKMGLPGDMTPSSPNATRVGAGGPNNWIEDRLGLAFHSDSAFVRGILERTTAATQANVNGSVIAARSENDTGNNPHNPMYGIARIGAKGELLTLIGSRASDSGGNSMAPISMIDPTLTPSVVTQARDVTGLVDTGALGQLFSNPQDAVAVLESMHRISGARLGNDFFAGGTSQPRVRTGLAADAAARKQASCNYVNTAYLADNFSNPATLNPDLDPDIVGPGGIFTAAEYAGDGEFRKTAAIMKMVINGYAGAGTITMGGYDYHGQGRATGEVRDLRAGRCMGAILEYAARRRKPVMLYVFSDGSLSAGGMVDNTADGRGKFMWTSDNQSTAANFFLVYNPNGRPQLFDGGGGLPAARHQQLGFFTSDGSVSTASNPGANNVLLLVQMVLLNYLALHGEIGRFQTLFPEQGLGAGSALDGLVAFQPIVQGRIA